MRALSAAGRLTHPLVLLDVGCRWGIPQTWSGMAPGTIDVFAFDADAEECARLQAVAPPGVTYVPSALSDRQGTGRLHVAREPGCSSLFPPDPDSLSWFPQLELMTQVGEAEIELDTLDGWASANGVTAVDALKLDVQGSELAVLRGAGELLRSVRAIETEVMFNPMYVGQPLFGDIDAFLRSHGFRLWRLKHLVHYSQRPGWDRTAPDADRQFFDDELVEFPVGDGQVTWGHALYCADRIAAGAWTDPQEALRDACAAELVGLDDLAALALAAAGD